MKSHPGTISIQDFSYDLPDEKIAVFPPAERDHSKLLVYEQGSIRQDIYKNLPGILPPLSMVLFNNTKVVPARLLFQKPTGGIIEIFCLEPANDIADVSTAMSETACVRWKCLVGGASKWKPGQLLQKEIMISAGTLIVNAKYIDKLKDAFLIEISWSKPAITFAEVLYACGAIPLPPYIKRKAEAADTDRYQTVYAETSGSVAAPTAGLHFTNDILNGLHQRNIDTDYITLHVGSGTFMPVKSSNMHDHEMHSEWIEVNINLVEKIIRRNGIKVVAVGTTTMRTIESLYWLGVKIHKGWTPGENEYPAIEQWEPYEQDEDLSTEIALNALACWLRKNNKETLVAKTSILIAPGYNFKIIDGLITNFHQPSSTLLLLVAAFTGTDWKKIYEYALHNEFRFLSYGDGSLLWRNSWSS